MHREVSSLICDGSCRAGRLRSLSRRTRPPGGSRSTGRRHQRCWPAHRRAGRWIGLSGQIAADLLPEAGDSWAVNGGEAI